MDMEKGTQISRPRSEVNLRVDINIPISGEVYKKAVNLLINPSNFSQRWHVRAACSDREPGLMFSEDNEGIKEAKKCCSDCPVQAECLVESINKEEKYGVWGGLTAKERSRFTKKLSTLKII